MLLFGHDKDIAKWVGHQIGVFDFGPCTAIGVARGDRLVAGAVFHAYRHPDIQFSFAGHGWGTRAIIRGIFRYPFRQLNVKRITCICPEKNAHAIAILERMGFVREGRHPDLFATGAGISIALYRAVAEERWLR